MVEKRAGLASMRLSFVVLITVWSISAVGADDRPGFWCPGALNHPDDGLYACERSREECEHERELLARQKDVIAPPCEHQARAVAFSYYDVLRDNKWTTFWRNTKECKEMRDVELRRRPDVRNVSRCKIVD